MFPLGILKCKAYLRMVGANKRLRLLLCNFYFVRAELHTN